MKNPTTESHIVGIQKDISYIQKDIQEIKQGIKDLAAVYVTKQEFDDEFKALKLRVQAQENSSHLWKWLAPILTGIFSFVLSFLVMNFLQNK